MALHFCLQEICVAYGIIHRKITPLWPQANSHAESFNKPMMKSIRAAHTEGKNWEQEMYKISQTIPEHSTLCNKSHSISFSIWQIYKNKTASD